MITFIEELCDTWKNRQNTILETLKGECPIYTSILETRSVKVENKGRCFSHKVVIPRRGMGLSNVRLVGDWKYAIIEVGSQIFDHVHKVFGKNTFELFDGGLCLPFVEYHDIVLKVYGTDFTMYYDIVSIENTKDEYLIMRQFMDNPYGDKLVLKKNQVEIGLLGCIETIKVTTEKPVEDVKVCFQKYQLPLTRVDDLNWKLTFSDRLLNVNNIINGLKCDFIISCNNKHKNNKMYTTSIIHEVLRLRSGMAGLAFM